MKAPKGFAKNYFTLSAIQAYSTHPMLHQIDARIHAFILQIGEECDEELSDGDLEALLCSEHSSVPAHAGHCNCYYNRLTRNLIRQNPRPKLLIRLYRYTNSAISPPYQSIYSSNIFNNNEGIIYD